MDSPEEANPTCEWQGCNRSATHIVWVDLPDGPSRTWRVCTTHDKDVKKSTVRSRMKAPLGQRESDMKSLTVYCGACKSVLDEPGEGPRQPCSICGSLKRDFDARLTESLLGLRSYLRFEAKLAGTKKRIKLGTGDAFTRDLETWGQRHIRLDSDADTYREVIVLADGTRIESSSRLRDHTDHGGDPRI